MVTVYGSLIDCSVAENDSKLTLKSSNLIVKI